MAQYRHAGGDLCSAEGCSIAYEDTQLSYIFNNL